MLYFDHNATHPLSARAREAWLEAVERFPGNPSSPHRLGARAEAALTQAREKLAGWLGCAPPDIVWTSGATEANNAVIHHAAATTAPDSVVWISAIEHPCTREATRRHFGPRHAEIPVTSGGVLDLAWLDAALRRARPALVGVMAANNETGVLQPWREALALCRAAGVPFFTDAAQWLGKLPAAGLGACEFVTGCAHKFGGPPGVGFMKVPARFRPLIVGGPQEDGRRAGTENVPGVVAMIAALDERVTSLTPEFLAARIEERTAFEGELTARLPGTQIIGAGAERLWNTVSAALPELPDCRQRWVVKLDKLGCAVSTGSACSSGKEQSSHVLTALGLSAGTAFRVLRFSSGWETRAEDWAKLVAAIEAASQPLANRDDCTGNQTGRN